MYEGKYYRLFEYLKHKQEVIRLTITFSEIEGILDFDLPTPAKKYNAWWANDKTHSQAISWLALLVGTQAK
ncbi:DUF7662 domain-containing protein [Niallia taxi]|uniref:DUF7662 domain-containing protein n=1 Tax=Niallia taxi TaxID=2499688 RepID=UPI00254C4121|nr:hypothetical protein [Niallia taxi]MDK8643453.1 hypothetical protein [Niallia taxi]